MLSTLHTLLINKLLGRSAYMCINNRGSYYSGFLWLLDCFQDALLGNDERAE